MLRKDDLQNGFFLYQNPEQFCFGVDAVLLAHFPEIRKNDRIIDLGCGFAPVPVILAARARQEGIAVRITGLEIQKSVADTARRSVMENGLAEEITIINGDLKEAASVFGAASFSLVTCNPPYIPVKSGIAGENRSKMIARTELLCTLEDAVKSASKLLRAGGRFDLVHRPARLAEIMRRLAECGLEPKRMRFVHPAYGREPSMVLVEAVKGGRPSLKVEPPLFIRDAEGNYTKELLDIYGMDAESRPAR